MKLDTSRGAVLTTQFYEWEKRGRGWQLAEYPVDLEPPFHPFSHHFVPTPYIDDGKRPTLLGTIADVFRKEVAIPQLPTDAVPEIEPFPCTSDELFSTIGISFQRGFQVKVDRMEQLLVMLSHCSDPVSFEIIANHTTITIQCAVSDANVAYVQSQVKAYFPECTMYEFDDALVLNDNPFSVIDFGLGEEFMRPIAVANGFDPDPFIGMFGLLEHLAFGEQVFIQTLFSGTVNSWSESIINSVSDGQKGSFFLDAPEMPKLAEEKVSRPLYGVCIRMFAQAPSLERASAILNTVGTALITASASKYNSLIGLSDQDYDVDTRMNDILERKSHRLGMLLNVRELASLVHFPSASIRSSKLVRNIKKTKQVPIEYTDGTYVLGTNIHQGVSNIVALKDEQRLKHIHIIGATGTGKTTLFQSLIYQDIEHGNGIAVLDPHGDLIETILSYVPEHRVKDVVLIDPADSEFPIGFNLLKAHSDNEKELLASDLVALFRRFSTSWGDQMNSVLANAILAFLESTRSGTLIDLRHFLIEKSYRDQFLLTVTDPQIIYYWQKEFPLIKSTAIGPILTRLDAFLRPKLIRNMVSQKTSLDFTHLMNTNKIVLVKLSEGLIGAENSFLLGASIVAKIQQSAMARQSKAKESRRNFFVYIDEFHHFITPSMSAILSGTRKYNVGLILAHQDMEQVSKTDSELASSLMTNAGTRICFRLGDSDAKKLESGFSEFTNEDLQNLETGEAIARVGRREHDFTISVSPVPLEAIQGLQETIIASSRTTYGTPKATIEAVNVPDTSVPEQEQPKKTEPVQEQIPQPPQPIAQDNKTINRIVEQQEQRQHRYLQTLIKKMAEDRGYKAEIELPTPDGKGKVDVSLTAKSDCRDQSIPVLMLQPCPV